ncbi:MAG: RecX family transcriptional regulator [Bacteroidales bacterium]|nr:RecX family transcriptional regulator [Bacteroidales bacterium]
MKSEKDSAYVLERMRALCSRREYCANDIMKKASDALAGDKEEAAKIVQKLLEEKYIDDLRYASAYARDKASISGWGIAKIKYMLSAKGIARETVSMALAEIDSDKAESRLEKLIENKYRSLKDDPQCRMKLLRFALGRGYSYDDAIPLIDRYVRGY